MAKFKIGRDYGFVGSDDSDIIEAQNQKDAEAIAWDWAMENVSSWAEEIKTEEE